MVTEELEAALRAGPKFIYVLPNFQNPPASRFRWNAACVVELADRYGVPIIEDDPYGQLRFEGRAYSLHRRAGWTAHPQPTGITPATSST